MGRGSGLTSGDVSGVTPIVDAADAEAKNAQTGELISGLVKTGDGVDGLTKAIVAQTASINKLTSAFVQFARTRPTSGDVAGPGGGLTSGGVSGPGRGPTPGGVGGPLTPGGVLGPDGRPISGKVAGPPAPPTSGDVGGPLTSGDVPIPGPRRNSNWTKGLITAAALLAPVTQGIRNVTDETMTEDYRVGQMSRRYLDYDRNGLQNYRSRINDLAVNTGASFEESFQLANISQRFGRGATRGGKTAVRNGLNTFGQEIDTQEQLNQGRASMEAAFSLGADRGTYFGTLETLGRTGAVGSAGKAGGFQQDQKQFAVTIAETLASGRLMDRLDEVLQGFAGLAQELSARGATIDPDVLGKAIASANVEAQDLGDARLQEKSTQVVGDISRTVSGMGYDPLAISTFTKMPGKGTGPGGVGSDTLYDYRKFIEGGDVIGQSQLYGDMFNRMTRGKGVQEVTSGQLSGTTRRMLTVMADRQGTTVQNIEDMIKIASGVANQASKGTGSTPTTNFNALKDSQEYRQVQAQGSQASIQLYTQLATAADEKSLNQSIERTTTLLQDKGLKTSAQQELYEQLGDVKAGAAVTINGTTYATNTLDEKKAAAMRLIAKNETQTAFSEKAELGTPNRLENFQSATNNLTLAFKEMATYVNQVNADLKDKSASGIRTYMGASTDTVAQGDNRYRDSRFDTSLRSGQAYVPYAAGQAARYVQEAAGYFGIEALEGLAASGLGKIPGVAAAGGAITGAAKTVASGAGTVLSKIPGVAATGGALTGAAKAVASGAGKVLSKIPGSGAIGSTLAKVAPAAGKLAKGIPLFAAGIQATFGEGGVYDMITGNTKDAGFYYPEAAEGGGGSMWDSAKDWMLRHKAIVRAGASYLGGIAGGAVGSLAGPAGTVVGGIAGGVAAEAGTNWLFDKWEAESRERRVAATKAGKVPPAWKQPTTPAAATTPPKTGVTPAAATAASAPLSPSSKQLEPTGGTNAPAPRASSTTPQKPGSQVKHAGGQPPTARTTAPTTAAEDKKGSAPGEVKISNPAKSTETSTKDEKAVPIISVNDMRVAKMIVESIEGLGSTKQNPASTWQQVSFKKDEASASAKQNAAAEISKEVSSAYGSRASGPVTPYIPPKPSSDGLSVGPASRTEDSNSESDSSSSGATGKRIVSSPGRGGSVAAPRMITAPKLREDAKMDGVGRVSAYFESGEGYDRVSSGAGDAGGASYGAFQFASKTGSVDTFLNETGYRKEFGNLQAGTAAFGERWKEMAKDSNFNATQLAYIRSHYAQPFTAAASKEFGVDFSARGKAVQEMLLSTGVQYGAGGTYALAGLKGKDVKSMSDAEIITAVQDGKLANVNTNFRDSSADVKRGVANRIVREKAMLLDMANGGTGPETVLPEPSFSAGGTGRSVSAGRGGGGGGSNHKVDINIRVSQDENGKISAKIDGPSTISIDFGQMDQFAGPAANASAAGAPGAAVSRPSAPDAQRPAIVGTTTVNPNASRM